MNLLLWKGSSLMKTRKIVLASINTVFCFSFCYISFPHNSQNIYNATMNKPSTGIVRNYDFDGNPIYDPEFCNRKSNLNELEEKVGHFEHDYYSEIYYFKVQGFDLGI